MSTVGRAHVPPFGRAAGDAGSCDSSSRRSSSDLGWNKQLCQSRSSLHCSRLVPETGTQNSHCHLYLPTKQVPSVGADCTRATQDVVLWGKRITGPRRRARDGVHGSLVRGRPVALQALGRGDSRHRLVCRGRYSTVPQAQPRQAHGCNTTQRNAQPASPLPRYLAAAKQRARASSSPGDESMTGPICVNPSKSRVNHSMGLHRLVPISRARCCLCPHTHTRARHTHHSHTKTQA